MNDRNKGSVHPGEPRRFSFVGVTTAKSAIVPILPVWASYLGLGKVTVFGHDLPLHAPPASYREVVTAIRTEPSDVGGLVTTHKIDLFNSCRDMFDYIDPYAELCGEASCLSKEGLILKAHAKDPLASGRALDEFVPQGHWKRTNAEALLLGAGGSNLAITVHLLTTRTADDRPSKIVVVDRDPERLGSMRALHERLDFDAQVEYVQNDAAAVNDRLIAELPRSSLVVNGTGMGKDRPGSPITDAAQFPRDAMIWELNYRGELGFLHQARRKQHALDLVIEDGWRYFVHGWTAAIEEIFHLEISSVDLEALADMAAPLRSARG